MDWNKVYVTFIQTTRMPHFEPHLKLIQAEGNTLLYKDSHFQTIKQM